MTLTPEGVIGPSSKTAHHTRDFVLIAFLAIMILGVSGGGSAMTRIFAFGSVVWLGEIPHSLYIAHAPVLFVLRAGLDEMGFETWAGPARVVTNFAAIGIVIAAVGALFYMVERPARRRFRDRFSLIEPA